MSYAAEAIRAYSARTGQPGDNALDAAYMYEWAVLRDMLDRLEVILDDEGVPRDVAVRVIRCMLYGSPSPAAAEERMRHEREMVKLLNERQPVPLHVPGGGPRVLSRALPAYRCPATVQPTRGSGDLRHTPSIEAEHA